MKPASDADTMARPTIGVSHWIPKCAKTASKACITPAVRLSSSAGINQLITSGGRIKMQSTKIIATNIAFGNCLLGFSSRLTWTAFISIPE